MKWTTEHTNQFVADNCDRPLAHFGELTGDLNKLETALANSTHRLLSGYCDTPRLEATLNVILEDMKGANGWSEVEIHEVEMLLETIQLRRRYAAIHGDLSAIHNQNLPSPTPKAGRSG